MGTQSFGNGSVQTVYPLTEDTAIKLTTALYYTPNGRSIQATGIEPDIIAKRARVEHIQPSVKLSSEADLKSSIANPKDQESKNPAPEVTSGTDDKENEVQSILEQDYQLNEALNLLKGLNVYAAVYRQNRDNP